MSSEFPSIPADITTITAPQIIGTLFNWCLFGVLSVQVCIYHLNFSDDKFLQKGLVYGTYLLEAVQTALSTADLYYWFASGYGNMIHLADVHISPWETPFLCGIIAAVVQYFFAYRIWKLRRSCGWLSILIILTSVIQTAGASGTAIQVYLLGSFNRLNKNAMIFNAIWLLGDTISDILIAGSMLYIFHKSKTEHQHGNKILARLVILVVETNILTAAVALLSFVLYAVFPKDSLFICTTLVMGKLYSNTLLVTFNNRLALRKVFVEEAPANVEGPRQRPPNQSEFPHRLLQKSTLDSTFGSTYHLSPNRSQNSNKPQSLKSIEIEVLKEVKVYEQPGIQPSLMRCRHQPGCWGCVPA